MTRLSYLTLLTIVSVTLSAYSFHKKVLDGRKTVVRDGKKEVITVKKVFVTLTIDFFSFRKKRILGKRESGFYR